ncbi:MAG: prepilin-type N-terminal cleavage/methylation domain-containing protein [Usitatibacter sp.]
MRAVRGFTLIEILIVLVIVALIISLLASLSSGLLAQQRRQVTITRLNGIDAALVQFVSQQRRLPCPADGAASTGTEGTSNASGCTGDQSRGVVPWIALGLSETDVTDGWGRRITYRLDPNLAGTSRMDMSKCDPAGTGGLSGTLCNGACSSADLATCTPPATYLATKGLKVKSLTGDTLMNPAAAPNTGAAYVLISHGETGGGAYFDTSLSTSTTTDGTEEAKNYAGLAYAAATSYYVDDRISDIAGTAHFDDLIARPSVLSVIVRAGLGPRPH